MENKKNYNIVLINGKVGAGKDTVGEFLIEQYNYKVFRYADRLKEVLYFAGWDGKKDLRGRKLLQEVGKAFRKWYADFWIDKLIKDIENSDIDRICITDVRHINELEKFKEKWSAYYPDSKYIFIKLIGPNRDQKREMDEETLSDSSETELDNYISQCIATYTIHNNSTIESLRYRTNIIIKAVFGYKE